MESDESIDLVAFEEVNAHGSIVATEEHKTPCEYTEKGKNVDPPRLHLYINILLLKFAIVVK